MKITGIQIEEHKHLENLKFDFTYPKGHPKFGQPLEKICIIGQSATGKTSILELIWENIKQLSKVEICNGRFIFDHYSPDFKGELKYLHKSGLLISKENSVSLNDLEFKTMRDGGGTITNLLTDDVRLLYFGSEQISKDAINIFNTNPLELQPLVIERKISFNKEFRELKYLYEFSQDIDETFWFSILSKILEYRKQFTQLASELINKGLIGDTQKLNNEFKKWADKNENPLIAFADFFDPILEKLNLKIDLVNTEYPIPIQSKIKDEIVPISGLSTGTKGLLLSLFPLFELNTTDAMILLDEPERSLFPDMQIELISHYQRIAPDAQLIVATHSPFIAAAFEPEERFILYFGENGKVAVRRGASPIGDDPNDMLKNDFKVDYYNQFGKDAYKQYLYLKRKVSQESEPTEKKKLMGELAELGDKYNF